MQPQPYGALRLAACEDLMVRRPQRDDLVLMANEETVLQDVIDKLIEIGRCYGMEMNVEKAKVMRISRPPSPVTIMIDQEQLENVECFKYLGNEWGTND